MHIDQANSASQGPLILNPAWRPQAGKLGLIIEYKLNSAFGSEPLTFHNLVLIAKYGGGRASKCQTKPTGTHQPGNPVVFWRLGDVALTSEWQKVICRLDGAENTLPEPGHIEARWEIHGGAGQSIGSDITLSRLESSKGKDKEESVDPFADDSVVNPTTASSTSSWVEVPASRKIVSGSYEARQVQV